jgi:hypothetical protein
VDAALGQTFAHLPPRRPPPLLRGHTAGVFEFCSGLVDLVVCVRHHGGGHRLTLAGERFVGRLTEDLTQVGDRGAELGDPTAARGLRANPAIVAAGS